MKKIEDMVVQERSAIAGKKTIGAYITVKNKKDDVRVIVTEKEFTNKSYIFHIPYEAWSARVKSTIEIPFDLNTGEPRRQNRWWDYQVAQGRDSSQILEFIGVNN